MPQVWDVGKIAVMMWLVVLPATALHYAAEAGHTQVVANLVIAGCLVHMGTSAGWTAAHLAASNGHAEVLQKLLVGGYEVDCISGTGGWTALHLAAHNGHVKVHAFAAHPVRIKQGPAEGEACLQSNCG